MNRVARKTAVQIAATGVRCLGLTLRRTPDDGRPPSREKAKIIRLAEVTVARPQAYWATPMMIQRTTRSESGTIARTIAKKLLPPCAAAALRSGAATITAHSIAQPKSPDHKTEWIMPFGTARSAFTVSSAVWADASNPVIV